MVIQLDYPPSANRVWRHSKNSHYQAAGVVAWKKKAAWTARAAGAVMAHHNVAMIITLHPKMTKNGLASKRRLDTDNVLKPTLDALNGIAYADDKQVTDIRVMVGDPLPDGGLTVEIRSSQVEVRSSQVEVKSSQVEVKSG